MRQWLSACVTLAGLLAATSVHAGPPISPPRRCAPDAALVGATCVDKYEATVWRIPDATGVNIELVKRVRNGKATAENLMVGGARQLGTASDDYLPCLDNGNGCKDDVYAVSLPGVIPSANITWFQSNIACGNSGKRLPSNAEWQMAVTGSPDLEEADNGTTDCNTGTAEMVVATGSRSGCVSAFGAFDMEGNLTEWVADWVPRSTICGTWSSSRDEQCLTGAATTGEPGALRRGGNFLDGSTAGPLAIVGASPPSEGRIVYGFRCAR
jgi:hypothetical protein